MFSRLFVLVALIIPPVLEASEEIAVPIYDQERPPLSFTLEGQPRGIYADLFREILETAGLKPTLIPTPSLRRRVGFETQVYHLSCCANPAWRNRPIEQEVQIFSKPFYWTKDIFVFPKGKGFLLDKLSQLSDKRVATVHGFEYRGSEYFGTQISFQNEDTLMRALTLGRADVGIVNEDIFYASPQQELLDIGPIHDQASLHIRIHRARSDLVEPINQAIDSITLNGRLDMILNSYLNKPSEVSP